MYPLYKVFNDFGISWAANELVKVANTERVGWRFGKRTA